MSVSHSRYVTHLIAIGQGEADSAASNAAVLISSENKRQETALVSLCTSTTQCSAGEKNHQGDATVTSPCNHVTICPPLCLRMHGMGEYVLKAALPVVNPQRKRTLLLSTRRWMSLAEGFYVPWTSVTFSLLWHIHAGESPGCVNRTSFSFFPHLLWNVTTCGHGHVWIGFISLIFSVPDTFPRDLPLCLWLLLVWP